MRSLHIIMAGSLIVAPVGCGKNIPTSASDEKKIVGTWEVKKGEPRGTTSDEKKIIGTWEVKKGEPRGTTIELSKDGNLKMTYKFQGEDRTLEGTYAIDGDTLTFILKGSDGEENIATMQIKTLTQKELVTEEKKDNKTETTEFARK